MPKRGTPSRLPEPAHDIWSPHSSKNNCSQIALALGLEREPAVHHLHVPSQQASYGRERCSGACPSQPSPLQAASAQNPSPRSPNPRPEAEAFGSCSRFAERLLRADAPEHGRVQSGCWLRNSHPRLERKHPESDMRSAKVNFAEVWQ